MNSRNGHYKLTSRSSRAVFVAAIALGISSPLVFQAQESAGSAPAASAFPDACGNPAPLAAGVQPQQPIFPAGAYPISLPTVSPYGVRNDLPNPYREGTDWVQLPPGRLMGSTGSVTAAPDGTIWVVDRCGAMSTGGDGCDGPGANVNPIFQFDTSGKMLRNFGAGLFIGPHKLTVDADGDLWIADSGGHQVLEMSQDGKVLMTIGLRGQRGAPPDKLDAPDEVVVAANGNFFIAEGHNGGGTSSDTAARISKFDKTGKFLKSWGKRGIAPGDFDVPHGIALDSRGRLFVADRQNNRIQMFDQDGNFIAQWTQFGRPSGIYIDKRTDTIYVSDSESRDGRTNTGRNALPQTGYGYDLGVRRGIRIGSARDGKVTAFIPDPCPYPYASVSTMGEGVTVDHDGNVYDAELSKRLRKFARK
jgi:DNA-binding beta-propeller fold protein YncE